MREFKGGYAKVLWEELGGSNISFLSFEFEKCFEGKILRILKFKSVLERVLAMVCFFSEVGV